jgi:O-antigen/teichoic acid export membrane protein
VSLVVSATLALSLVPQFGLSGAVISSSVARVLVFLVLTITTVRTRPVELPISAIGRLAASALLAAFAGYVPVFAMGETPGHLLGGLLYLGAFAFATVGLGAWQPRDVGLLIRAAKTHPRYFGRCVPVLENWASRIRLK